MSDLATSCHLLLYYTCYRQSPVNLNFSFSVTCCLLDYQLVVRELVPCNHTMSRILGLTRDPKMVDLDNKSSLKALDVAIGFESCL
jgi:hypothetical protein